jgi:fibronectin type III domain protein
VAGVVRRRLVTALVISGVLAGCGAGRSGVLDLSWTAPTANVDGSPAADIVSYRVYYGTTPSPCPGGTFVTVPSPPGTAGQNVTARLTKLNVGELYHVAVTAVSSSGAQSACSAAASNRARKPN